MVRMALKLTKKTIVVLPNLLQTICRSLASLMSIKSTMTCALGKLRRNLASVASENLLSLLAIVLLGTCAGIFSLAVLTRLMVLRALVFTKKTIVVLPNLLQTISGSLAPLTSIKSPMNCLLGKLRRNLASVASENLLSLLPIVLLGTCAGIFSLAVLTRLSTSSTFNYTLEIASHQTKRFTELKSNESFVLRTENKGVAMQLPHVLTESMSAGNEQLCVRHWVYKNCDSDSTSKRNDSEMLRAENVIAICEVVRTGTQYCFDVRVRIAVKQKDDVWRWMDLGSGDADSRLLSIGVDPYSPMRLVEILARKFLEIPIVLPTLKCFDYLATARPTNSSAVEICFNRLSEKLQRINPVISRNDVDFQEVMIEAANRIVAFDSTLQSTPSLFTVCAMGGSCQFVAFAVTGTALLFLLLQLASSVANKAGQIGGDFIDECSGFVRLTGLVGTLVFLGAALSCVAISPDDVKNAVATSQMTSLAGQAFWTTLISSVSVRLIEAVTYVLRRSVGI
jgi:hypothetical protein